MASKSSSQKQSFHCEDPFSASPLHSDECLALMVERKSEHLPATDYSKRIKNGNLDFGARQQIVDWIEKTKVNELAQQAPWMKMLLAYSNGSIKDQVQDNTEDGLVTIMEGIDIQIPENLTNQGYENCAKMRVFMLKAVTSCKQTLLNTIRNEAEELHSITSRHIIEAGPVGERKESERISMKRMVAFAMFQALFLTLIRLSKYAVAYKKYIAPSIANLGNWVIVVDGILMFIHVLVTEEVILSQSHSFMFNALMKTINIGGSTCMMFLSVGLGCKLADETVKDVYLMLISTIISFYATLMAHVITPGYDARVPEVFACFAFYLCCWCSSIRRAWLVMVITHHI